MPNSSPTCIRARRADPPTWLALSRTLAEVAVAGLVLSVHPARAQVTPHRLVVPLAHGDGAAAVPADHLPPERLVPRQAGMYQAFPQEFANADGSDVWPCLGHATPNGNCPTVGNPVVPLPPGAFVSGFPAYSWALNNDDIFGHGVGNGVGCDAFVNGSTGIAPSQYKVCGQIATFYEDDTGDFTNDLLQRVLVTQGPDVIFDSGLVDFGAVGPGFDFPIDVILWYDVNFGYWPGAHKGPNNANCSPDINYPLAAAAFPPGGFYEIAAGSTCRRPVAGKAHVHTETLLATPHYTQVTGDRCTNHNVASPCFVTSWDSKKDKMVQDFDIFLR